MAGISPTVQRRRLGAALRTLRDARGLTGEQAGEAVERSASWISRIEGGRMGVRARDLRDLLDLYGVTEPTRREELLGLAQEGRERGWWSEYSGSIPEGYAQLIGLESEASKLAIYEAIVITGLLQTEDYARDIMSGAIPPLDVKGKEDRVQVRMRRQAVLTKSRPLNLSLILTERALNQPVGSRDIMRRQLEHLVRTAERPNVEVRILLDKDVEIVGNVVNFVLIHLGSSEPDAVYVEDLGGGALEEGKNVKLYQDVFVRFGSRALSPQQSIIRIRQALHELVES